MFKIIILIFTSFSILAKVPNGFEVVKPTDAIKVDIKYYTADNFVQEKIKGYNANKCYLSKPAAKALNKAANYFRGIGVGIVVYDCYRPLKSSDHFVEWSKKEDDPKAKKRFYPKYDKKELFKLGYLSEKSGHSRGSTVDLGLYFLESGKLLDMGTEFDFFGKRSHTDQKMLHIPAIKNRQLLRIGMEAAGFKNYPNEWWQYTLAKEPHAKKHFNFDIQ